MPRVEGIDVARARAVAQPPAMRNGWEEISNKVKAFVLSIWGAVILAAGVAAMVFGIKIGLIVGAIASLGAFCYQSLQQARGQAPEAAVPNAPAAPAALGAQAERPAVEPVRYDDQEWEFHYFNAGPNGMRGMNAELFQQTLQVIERGGINRFGERIEIDRALHQEMIEGVRPIDMTLRLLAPRQIRPLAPLADWVQVRAQTTYEAIAQMRSGGFNPLVLDMANAYVKGGGVLHGSLAQEETLCRQSNLYLGLEEAERQRGYPIPVHGGILVPKVQFFRRDADQAYRFAGPIVADVFASAAFNCNRRHEGGYDRPINEVEYRESTKEKMRTMFRMAIENGNDSLILSAFGCGAFRNDPELIARLYREVMEEPEFNRAFRMVRFGIYDPPGVERPNMPVFQRVLLGNH